MDIIIGLTIILTINFFLIKVLTTKQNYGKIDIMKQAKEIRNGSLYFNTALEQVERALGKVNSSRILTARHENQVKATRVANLRRASNDEVENYINESDKLKGGLRSSLPPLPSFAQQAREPKQEGGTPVRVALLNCSESRTYAAAGPPASCKSMKIKHL